MPVRPPALDDRGYDDLVGELLARIPAHTPEWTNPRPGDPGRTAIELFAWLADTLLYRANLVPERQRLAFLSLLDVQMRPAIAASGVVRLALDDKKAVEAVHLRRGASIKGPVNFETTEEVTVLPVTAEAYYKRPLGPDESASMRALLTGLQSIYNLDAVAPYVTTPVFAGGLPEQGGFDLVQRTADRALWLALLAPEESMVEAVRATLGGGEGHELLNVGIVPSLQVPALFEDVGPRARTNHVWEITHIRRNADGRERVEYHTLDEIDVSTAGLTRPGAVRLVLPSRAFIGAPANDVRQSLNAGVGDTPPRIDAPEVAARIVTWLRLRPGEGVQQIDLAWVGINAVDVDQRQTFENRVIGVSDGSPDQAFALGATSVQAQTFELEVEEPGRGYQSWRRTDDLLVEGREAVFVLDEEAGTVRFGDGMRGRIPDQGRRVRAVKMRAGGGAAGNVPAGKLTGVDAGVLQDGRAAPKLKVSQPLPMFGGSEAESLSEAERRIPRQLRHANRAVTAEDYRELALETPGVSLGRVELMPRFKPQQRREGVPGVVSVMVLPSKATRMPPNPRAGRPTLEAVHAYLDARRPLATELYVIGCEYVPLGVSTSIGVRNGFGREETVAAVKDALRRHLWSLPPGGLDGSGWPLGQAVRDRELEVVVARTPGVASVVGLNLFEMRDGAWRMLARGVPFGPVALNLQSWQLPELLASVVAVDEPLPEDLVAAPNPFAAGVAIPVVPEECD